MPSDDWTEISSAVLLSLIGDAVLATDHDGNIFLFNQAAEEMFGYTADEVFGRNVEMLMPQRFQSSHGANLRNFVEAREPERRIMGRRREVVALRKNGQEFPIEATVSRRQVRDRTVLTVVVRDIAERKRIADDNSAHRELRAAETGHRLMNTLALVGALVRLSARGATSVEEYRRVLEVRLKALAENQRIIAGAGSGGTSLAEMLRVELDPYYEQEGDNVDLDGPPITFSAETASMLGLALHELATNAAKYGALSAAGGSVSVTWVIEEGLDERRLILNWREQGGPTVAPPERRGLGSIIIERTVVRALRGSVAVDYHPDGVRCRFEVPLGVPS